MKKLFVLVLIPVLVLASIAQDADAPKEEDFYKIITIPIPKDIVLEVGGLEWMPDKKLAISTRRGEIWMLENPLADPPSGATFKRYAHGLHEVLGIAYNSKDGCLYATQRPEVTRIKDTDKDGRADVFETVSDDWGITGDYHEYAIGSKFDKEGNIWVVLCLTGSFTSDIDFRGWCVRVTPKGEMIPTAGGIRSPGGIGFNAAGDVFYCDNQGPWNGSSSLKHLAPGGFLGHPGGNKWYKLAPDLPEPISPKDKSRMHVEAKKIPQYYPPAVILPHGKLGNSSSAIITDTTGGKFGPFAGQLFVADQSHSNISRVFLEKINGRYQGAAFMFRTGFDSGNLAFQFAPDNSLFVGGTQRGWGARGGKDFALQRLVWTGKAPFEVHEMRAKPDGFELTFTQPVDTATAGDIASYKMETFTYIFQGEYGSPEVDKTTPTITSVKVAPDKKSVRLIVDGLQEGHVHTLNLDGVRSATGSPLLHKTGYYTMNQIPQK